jgi:hypothetical protein
MAETKTPRQLLEEAQKAKADAIAKEELLLKQLREDDLALVKKLIVEHGFTVAALRSSFATATKAKEVAKKATPRKSVSRKKAK